MLGRVGVGIGDELLKGKVPVPEASGEAFPVVLEELDRFLDVDHVEVC